MWDFENIIFEHYKVQKDKVYNLYFEFAPSGFIHVGIIRVLFSMNKIKNRLKSLGIEAKLIIGIQDRYTIKSNNHFHAEEALNNKQLVDVKSPYDNTKNYLEFFTSDFINSLNKFNLTIDEIKHVSDLYKKENLTTYFTGLLQKQVHAMEKIKSFQNHIPTLYFPKCDSCGKMYESDVNEIDADYKFSYKCKNCGNESTSSLLQNNGAFTFKIEAAIKFSIFNIDIQFAGLDHYDALKVSSEINQLIFGKPFDKQFYIVNMVLNNFGEVIHKSKGNSKAISNFTDEEIEFITKLLNRTNNSTLLKLPISLSLKSH
ncbi:MAG: hypothetical protein Q8M15_04765 [Bacteroidota bacterium]|nr:hypothetical protein [Bacteroidota bacterium]